MCNDFDSMFKPIVLVTGFGPYLDHPINASWEAVKIMNKAEIESRHNIELVQLEIPVTYENVDEFVPALWETHTPKLMIHVGMSGKGKCLTLESQAHKKGYQQKDYFDKCPIDHVCTADGAIRLQTKLDVNRISKEFNDGMPLGKNIKTEVSKDAGRYLCEYIYYTSLTKDNTRTLFVHVPAMDVYSSEETARGLERILDLCLDQIHEKEKLAKTTDTLKGDNTKDKDE